MSGLELNIDDDIAADALYGSYSNRRALAILNSCFDGRISEEDAAAQISNSLPSRSDRKASSESRYRLAYFLLDVAEQIPYSHPAQTKLVLTIRMLNKSVKLSYQSEVQGYLAWYRMEEFGWELREGFPASWIDYDGTSVPDEYHRGLNFSSFCARLLQCGELGRCSFPIWQMRHSLESKWTDGRGSQFSISCASLWYIFAGQAVYTQVVEVPYPPGEGTPMSHTTGKLYDGPEQGLERWRFWKNALADAGGDKEATSEHCALARKAVAVMEAIEQSMAF